MPIRVACSCGKRLNAPDSLAGKTGKCPACGGRIAIPGPGPAAPVPASSDKPPPSGPRPGSLPKPWWVPRLLAGGIGLTVAIVLVAIGTLLNVNTAAGAIILSVGGILGASALISFFRPRTQAEQAARVARIRAKADAYALGLAAAEAAGADPMTLSKKRLTLACDYCLCGFYGGIDTSLDTAAQRLLDGDIWDGDLSLLARAKQELQWLVANSPNPRDREAAQKRLGPLLEDVEKWRALAQHQAAANPDSPEAQAARAYLERLEQAFPVA